MSKFGQLSGSFADHELMPASGLPVARYSDVIIEKVAHAMSVFNQIHIKTSRHEQVHQHYKRVMAQRITPGSPVLGGRVLGPSGSGKTTSARHFKAMIEAQMLHAPGDQPVVIAPLENQSTSRRLFVSIMTAIGDQFANRSTEELLKERVYMALRRNNTRLLIVDEVQHLASRSRDAHSTTDTLKRVLDDGVCPLVFLGTDDATDFLNSNVQLANRLMPPADMKALNADVREERKLFATYVDMLDRELVVRGLTSRVSGLAEKRVLSSLFAISNGVLGRVSNLVRVALDHALSREAEIIEVYDLSAATTSWAIASGLLDYNPFLTSSPKKRGGRA